MSETQRRQHAVLNALRIIRNDVKSGRALYWNSDTSDRWIDALDGLSELELESLKLEARDVWHKDYLLHLDTSIAFLEAIVPPQANAGAAAAQGASQPVIDAEFTDLPDQKGNSAAGSPRWRPRLLRAW